MSPLLRRRRPRRVRIRTVVVVASGVVALVGSLVLSRTDTMAWFDLADDSGVSADTGLRMLEVEGETPAERVVTELAAWAQPSGWKVGKPQAWVSDPFGLTCLDGPVAWSTSRSRSLSGDDGEGQVAVLAYPAGGGGAAYAQVAESAGRCADGADETEFGVASLSYRKGGTAVQVVRRGDVLAVVSSTPAERLPSEAWLTQLDDRLSGLLGDACLAEDSPATEASRNPWIDPEAFQGNVVMDPVPFPADLQLTRAEDVATDPVVPLNTVPPTLPDVGERPATLDPPAPDLPDMPEEVARPEAPQPPAEPDLDGRAARAVADPDGPGCGWAFTGEAVPTFDEAVAARNAEKAVKAERKRIVDAAVEFEQAKVNFYRAWVQHLAAVTKYQEYGTALAAYREQYQLVVDARAAFVAEFEKYRASLQAFEEFQTRRAAAQTAYDAELQRCATLPLTEVFNPDNGCPPQRPAVLDEAPPTVLARPVAAPQAQLPLTWEPPAPVAEPEQDDEEAPRPRRDRDDRDEDRGGREQGRPTERDAD